jgi:hypothetical protein
MDIESFSRHSICSSLDLAAEQDLIIACLSIPSFATDLARHHLSASKCKYLKKRETSVRQTTKAFSGFLNS